MAKQFTPQETLIKKNKYKLYVKMGGINCVGKEMIELNWFDASLYAILLLTITKWENIKMTVKRVI